MGYVESKHVVECILNTASQNSEISISILKSGINRRSGLCTRRCLEPRDEWFPSLIKTSSSLGYLPDYVADADWIPVDAVAATVLDITAHSVLSSPTTTTRESLTTYDIVNPYSTAWTSLIETVLGRLGPRGQSRTIARMDRNAGRD